MRLTSILILVLLSTAYGQQKLLDCQPGDRSLNCQVLYKCKPTEHRLIKELPNGNLTVVCRPNTEQLLPEETRQLPCTGACPITPEKPRSPRLKEHI